MKIQIRRMIFTKTFGIAILVLVSLFGFSLFFEYDDHIFLPIVTIFNDAINDYTESIRKSNYDSSNVLDCNDVENPYNEYECFGDAFSNCYAATVNSEIYTIEGDPIYTTLKITPDCKIQGTADTSTDRFAIPEIILTECKSVGRGDYTWSVGSCDVDNMMEMEFNFEMQLYPKVIECEKNGNTWVRESLECVEK